MRMTRHASRRTPRPVRRTKIRNGADFLRWEPLLCEPQRTRLAAVPAPVAVLGRRLPASLDALSFEALSRLWAVRTSAELLTVGAEVVLGLSSRAVLTQAPALQVIGFCNWLMRELERVNVLWAEIRSTRTSEEVMAGVDDLAFGAFGLADWYARRMGMHNHDEAFATPWPRVWQCLRMDTAESEYRKRLQKIINDKTRRK